MVPLTVEQLATSATVVVHGRVEWVESSRDAQGRIHTRVGLGVLATWKGGLAGDGRHCEIVLGGGVVGQRAVRVVGQADHQVGDEVVAYLARNEAGDWVTLGLGQGRFLVRREAGSERRLVSNPFWGEEAAGDPGGKPAPAIGVRMPARRPLTLEELERRTREVGP